MRMLRLCYAHAPCLSWLLIMIYAMDISLHHYHYHRLLHNTTTGLCSYLNVLGLSIYLQSWHNLKSPWSGRVAIAGSNFQVPIAKHNSKDRKLRYFVLVEMAYRVDQLLKTIFINHWINLFLTILLWTFNTRFLSLTPHFIPSCTHLLLRRRHRHPH